MALRLVDEGLTRTPDDPGLITVKGNILIATGKAADAAQLFMDLIRRHGNDPVLLTNLAWARLHEGRATESLKIFDSVPVEQRGASEVFDLGYAQAAYRVQRYELASAALDRYLARQPHDPSASDLKALLLLDTGQNQAACTLATALLDAGSTSWVPHFVLGVSALEAQDGPAAERYLARSVELDPSVGRAWSARGFAALLGNDQAAAKGFFEEAVKHLTDHPGTWQGLAWSCILQKDLTAARMAAEHALKSDRNLADNHGTLAVIEVLRGRKTEAELLCRKALKLDPTAPSALYARSLLQEKAGDLKGAAQVVDTILGRLEGGPGVALLQRLIRLQPATRIH